MRGTLSITEKIAPKIILEFVKEKLTKEKQY